MPELHRNYDKIGVRNIQLKTVLEERKYQEARFFADYKFLMLMLMMFLEAIFLSVLISNYNTMWMKSEDKVFEG